jgi:hypothetical protein
MRRTRLYELTELRLGRDLKGYVQAARNDGLSWRRIADELNKLTSTDVTWETLRVWFTPADVPARTVIDIGEHTHADPEEQEPEEQSA